MAELLGNGPPHFNVLLLIINSAMANLKSKRALKATIKVSQQMGEEELNCEHQRKLKREHLFALIMLSHIQDLHSQSILLSCYNAVRAHLIVLTDELISYKTSATRQSKHLRYNK